MKVKAIGNRNKKLERKLQEEIMTILNKPIYKGLPMMVVSNLWIQKGTSNALIDVSDDDYCFIFLSNIFEGTTKTN